jgi:peptidyl-prolyl cis-trans isomerase SurA
MLLLLSLSSQAHAQIIDRVYARVGDDIITRYDVESLHPERTRAIYAIKDPDEKNRVLSDYTKATLDFLVDQFVILNAARREGVRVSDAEVENAIKDVLANNRLTMNQLTELLREENRTIGQYRWQLRMDILASRVRSRLLAPKVVVTEAEIRKYIIDNENILQASEQFEIRILDLGSEEVAQQAVEHFKKRKSFAATVKQFDIDYDDTYLGWFELNALEPSLRNLLKDKKKGEISEVHRFGDVYRILYIQDTKDKYEGTAEMRQAAINVISEEKTKTIYENWLKEGKQRVLVQYMY